MTEPAGGTGEFHVSRLRRVRDRLHDDRLDGLLVSNLANLRYLCGFSGSSGLLLVEPGAATLITDFRYQTQVAMEVREGISVSIAAEDLFAELAVLLRETGGGRRLGFEEGNLTVRERRELGEACGGVVWEPAGGLVDSLRAEKDPVEAGCIEWAVGVAEEALSRVLPNVRTGITELVLAAELDYHLRLAGSESSPFDTIVASGPRSALPHARPGEHQLEGGDLVLFDFGATVDGYCSDITRTFTVGRAAPWQRDMHAAVREAAELAIRAVGPGVPAREVDRAARDVLEEAGFGACFGHGTGHGVGLEVHEMPRINRRSREELKVGNVVTIEPGVYLPGRGGVRLEEVVLVENGGHRVLSSFSRELAPL